MSSKGLQYSYSSEIPETVSDKKQSKNQAVSVKFPKSKNFAYKHRKNNRFSRSQSDLSPDTESPVKIQIDKFKFDKHDAHERTDVIKQLFRLDPKSSKSKCKLTVDVKRIYQILESQSNNF